MWNSSGGLPTALVPWCRELAVIASYACWAEQPWRYLACGAPIDPYLADTNEPVFKTYRRVVANLAHSIELKRLPTSAAEPTAEIMRGLTIPPRVRVASDREAHWKRRSSSIQPTRPKR